jgi:mRNA interferase RelE/StbE
MEAAIELLGEEPRPPAARKPAGRAEYRVRVSSYRIIYRVTDSSLEILVVRVGHRREV